jgi:alpha-amylase
VINVTNHDVLLVQEDNQTKQVIRCKSRWRCDDAGIYWDVPAGGTWWNTINTKNHCLVKCWNCSIWLPPVSKAQNGPFSMGYDPTDYFDFEITIKMAQ